MIKNREESYNIEIDNGENEKLKLDNINANYIWAYNGKFGGGGMVLSPYSIVNDGFLELFYVN